MKKYMDKKTIITVVVCAFAVIGLYFMVATIIQTKIMAEVSQKNIEVIVQYINQLTGAVATSTK